MAKLSKIEGLDNKSVAKLKAVGITTIEKLLTEGLSDAGRKEIARRTKLNEKLISKWVNHADLFRIKGLAGLKTELLEQSGVPNMKELAKKNADQLHALITDINAKKKIVERVPGMIQVKRWVETAKKINKIVK